MLGAQRLSGNREVDDGAIRRLKRSLVQITVLTCVLLSAELYGIDWIVRELGIQVLAFLFVFWVWPIGFSCRMTVVIRRQWAQLSALRKQRMDIHG